MKKHISFPSIEQFRNIVATVTRQCQYTGEDETGEPIYDPTRELPKLKFKGTVKLHGNNASVCYNSIDGMWAQSRSNIITPTQDNAGFASFVDKNKEVFMKFFKSFKYNPENFTISIFGEWCGQGIQRGVGIADLPKSFFIFGVKTNQHDTGEGNWIDYSHLRSYDNNIYNIDDYKTYEIEIDFNKPQLSQNQIIEMTLEVEESCPVAKAFQLEGIGEGIVFTTILDGHGEKYVHRFKSKGEKHSKSKVKVLREVDDDKINKVYATAEKVCPEWRLEQMLTETFDLNNGGTLSRNKMGDYIKAVVNDVIKEDMDILHEAGLEPKDLGKPISDIARKYFFAQEASF